MPAWLQRLLSGLLGTKPTPTPPPAKPGMPPANWGFAVDFLALLNRERDIRRLPLMALDAALNGVAQAGANDQAKADWRSHAGYPGRVRVAYPDRASAENVAEGSSDAASTFTQWMNSPAHFRNMMGPYKLAGIGRATASSGRTYWCADFAA